MKKEGYIMQEVFGFLQDNACLLYTSEMQRGDYVLGGEQSGHIIFADLLPTGDGLLTSLQLLQVMVEKGASLSSLAAIMPRLPQLQVNCAVPVSYTHLDVYKRQALF